MLRFAARCPPGSRGVGPFMRVTRVGVPALAARSRSMAGVAKAEYVDVDPVNKETPMLFQGPPSVVRTEPLEEMGVLYQPGVPSPRESIESVPPIEIDGFIAKCDGGGGPLGHPVEYIKVPAFSREHEGIHRAGECKYCGLRFVSKQYH